MQPDFNTGLWIHEDSMARHVVDFFQEQQAYRPEKYSFQIDISIQISLSNNGQLVELEVPLASALGSHHLLL